MKTTNEKTKEIRLLKIIYIYDPLKSKFLFLMIIYNTLKNKQI